LGKTRWQSQQRQCQRCLLIGLIEAFHVVVVLQRVNLSPLPTQPQAYGFLHPSREIERIPLAQIPF
jgi:hypothetical protein